MNSLSILCLYLPDTKYAFMLIPENVYLLASITNYFTPTVFSNIGHILLYKQHGLVYLPCTKALFSTDE